jgi:hypothetical protein
MSPWENAAADVTLRDAVSRGKLERAGWGPRNGDVHRHHSSPGGKFILERDIPFEDEIAGLEEF